MLVFISRSSLGYHESKRETRWNRRYDFIHDIQSITFHYHHGILAGSYPAGRETTYISFDDVSSYLGHVCLCGAGGFRIAQIAVNLLGGAEEPLERGDFTLISSRDHDVSDIIAYVLGCSRRNDPEKNRYFIDDGIKAPRREYHYYIGYHPLNKAVHIIYRKHLLIGNELMDKLWKVEIAYDKDPASASRADIELYQDMMFDIVRSVLADQKEGLFEAEQVDYDYFLSMLNRLKAGM